MSTTGAVTGDVARFGKVAVLYGGDSAERDVSLASGARIRPKGQQSIPAGDRLRLEMAGGGGFGDPRQRDPARVAEDVENGFVSVEAARRIYRVVLDAAGDLDETDLLQQLNEMAVQ